VRRETGKESAGTKTNVSKKTGSKNRVAMADGMPPDVPNLPAADCPVLIGLDCIAAWLGVSRGRCRGPIDDGAGSALVVNFEQSFQFGGRTLALLYGAAPCKDAVSKTC
jgi:hypothetical protein